MLGALGREPLYAADECRGAIVLVLSELLSVGSQPSAEHSLALQLIEAIAQAPAVPAWATYAASGAAVGGGEAAANGGAAPMPSASTAAGSSGGQPRTIAALCHRLMPHLAPRWVWWLVRNPPLLSAVARSLCDTDEASLLQRLAPRAVPRIVLVGALDMPLEGDSAAGGAPGMHPGSAAAARLSVADADDYAALASAVLKELASRLEAARAADARAAGRAARPSDVITPKALLVEHMHLILSEVFAQVAGDPEPNGGEMACAIPNALTFMYDHEIQRNYDISSMINMCNREVRITRLPRAAW